MFRTISSAIVLAALWAADAHALVESKCVSPRGELRGVVEILPDAEAQRRIACTGPYQSEILTQVVDIFPSARALELGLVPQAAMPVLVEGFAVNRTDWLEAFPEHAPVGSAMGILIDILDEANDESLGRGCALWFLVSGTFGPDDPAFLNLNGQPQVFGFLDHDDVGLGEQLMDAQAAIIVGPAPSGDARAASQPVRFALQDGTVVRLEEAQVAFGAMGKEGCWGSVRISIEEPVT
jgi:hypothetical protein